MKVSVPQERIRRMIKAGANNRAIWKKIHIPIYTINKIRAGKDVPYYYPKTGSTEKDMCTHCGARKKGRYKTFLCDYCYENATCGEIYKECTLNI